MAIHAWKIIPKNSGTLLGDVALPAGLLSLDDADPFLPPGVYTTFRTYQKTKVLHLDDHFTRLEESAALAGKALLVEASLIRRALRQVIQIESHIADSRIRLVIGLEDEPGAVYIIREPLLLLPPEAYRSGVHAIICDLQRQLPKAKLTNFITQADQLRRGLPPGVNEALMVDAQGHILEGLSSNFFAVKGEALYTASEGVLDGITRSLVIGEAARLDIPLIMAPASVMELPYLEETFITSAGRSVLPVVRIEPCKIANGKPGPITRNLMTAYANRLRLELEDI
jgi:branched-chain amino acid aminotransferase